MKRKDFFKKGLLGIGSIMAIPTTMSSCVKDGETDMTSTGDCTLSPSETAGPFPIKSPAELVRANIVSDREGIALLVTLRVLDQSNDCQPVPGVYVDIWHCDADGNYSEYGGTGMQSTNYSNAHFLRGRQMTDDNGTVSFITIYPGWYPGRAPHIHVEVLDSDEQSIRVTQIAFPEDTSSTIYGTEDYQGDADTSNTGDNIFSNSLDDNMVDSITGNIEDGFLLFKDLVI